MKTHLDMDKIAKGLGAERRGKISAKGGYFGALQLLADIEVRLRVPAGGGRPTDPRWTERRLVPLAPETLDRLEQLTVGIREHGNVNLEPNVALTREPSGRPHVAAPLAARHVVTRQIFPPLRRPPCGVPADTSDISSTCATQPPLGPVVCGLLFSGTIELRVALSGPDTDHRRRGLWGRRKPGHGSLRVRSVRAGGEESSR